MGGQWLAGKTWVPSTGMTGARNRKRDAAIERDAMTTRRVFNSLPEFFLDKP